MTYEEFWFGASMSILGNLLRIEGWTSSSTGVEDVSSSIELMTSSFEAPICIGAVSSILEVKGVDG